MSKKASKARVGFLIFLGVITITVATFFIGEKTHLFSDVYYIRVNFKSAEGVKPGGSVLLSGYSIGTVWQLDLSPTGDSVRLTLRLEDRVRPLLKSEAKAFIGQEGLVGNKFIRLELSEKGNDVGDYCYIQGIEPFGLSEIMRDTRELVDTTKYITGQLKDVLNQINSGRGTLGRLLVDEGIYRNLQQISARADSGLSLATIQLASLSTLLIQLTKSVHRVVDRADSTMQDAHLITSEGAKFMANLNEGKGTFGALVTERAMYDSIATLIGLLQNVSIDASNAADQIAKGMYGVRTHWLLGRVFGGDDVENEKPPQASFQQKIRALLKKERELEEREKKIQKRELLELPHEEQQKQK